MKNSKISFVSLLAILLCCTISCDNVNPDRTPGLSLFTPLEFENRWGTEGTAFPEDYDFVGDAATNSLHMAYHRRTPGTHSPQGRSHLSRIMLTKRDEQNTFGSLNYVPNHISINSRKLLIDGNQVYMLSPDMITTFQIPLALSTDPNDLSPEPTEVTSQIQTGARMFQFGAVLRNGDIYTFGGRTDDFHQQAGDAICRWNKTTDSFDIIGHLPTPRFWSAAELIGDKAYIFGGQNELSDFQNPQSTVYVYDFSTKTTSTFSLPKGVNRTYTAAYQDKIIVGGRVITDFDETDPTVDFKDLESENYLGVFDTATNEFIELEHNLEDNDQNILFGLTVVGDTMYVLHGPSVEEEQVGTGDTTWWFISEADLTLAGF